MVKQRNKLQKKESSSVAEKLLVCLINSAISFSVFTVLSIILTSVTLSKSVSDRNIKAFLYIIILLTAVFAGFLSSRVKLKAIVSSSVTALILVTMLFLLFCVISSFDFTYRVFITLLSITLVTIISGIIFKNLIH